MWKVLVVLCTLGNPCTVFEEDPTKWYSTEAECMMAAHLKAESMMKTMLDYGYYVESEAHSCLYVHQTKSI